VSARDVLRAASSILAWAPLGHGVTLAFTKLRATQEERAATLSLERVIYFDRLAVLGFFLIAVLTLAGPSLARSPIASRRVFVAGLCLSLVATCAGWGALR
jgi:hypothetical protein